MTGANSYGSGIERQRARSEHAACGTDGGPLYLRRERAPGRD